MGYQTGWRSLNKNGEERYEGHEDAVLGGRPVDAGEEGNLLLIEQHDFGHRVCIDLIHGIILIDYEEAVSIQGNTVEAKNPKTVLWIGDDSNIAGDMYHLKQNYRWARDENGKKIRDDKGQIVQVRDDILIPLTWRPIWFSRVSQYGTIKAIGAQTTLPEMQGEHNCKKMVFMHPDGRLSIF